MKKRILVVGSVLSSIVFYSCSSSRNTTDNTAYSNKTHHKKTLKFIDDIAINAGSTKSVSVHSKATKKHAIVMTTKTVKSTTVNTNNTSDAPSTYTYSPSIRHASSGNLPSKYSPLLNTTEETLSKETLLLAEIEHWWGTPYLMGGNTENGIDCSALCQTFYKDLFQISLPRTSQEQFSGTARVDSTEMQKGDLVFFGNGNGINHVGMYLMNNKFVHASTSKGVMISDLNERYWKVRFKGAGRYSGNNLAHK